MVPTRLITYMSDSTGVCTIDLCLVRTVELPIPPTNGMLIQLNGIRFTLSRYCWNADEGRWTAEASICAGQSVQSEDLKSRGWTRYESEE